MGEAAKQARMMQIPAHDMSSPATNNLVDKLAALFSAEASPERFEAEVCAMFDGPGRDYFQHLHASAMIVPEVLATLAGAARSSKGAVLEIGPYVGASTLAISLGLRDSDREFLTIESGGINAHPTRGTDDVLRDLKANLATFGVSDRVHIVEGWAHEVCQRLPSLLQEKIGFLFIDADGSVDVHINNVKQLLASNCLLAFDDWKAEGKGARVRRTVEKLIEREAVISYGVLFDDTWFGRLNGEHGLGQLSCCREFEADLGYAYWAADVYPPTPSDGLDGDRSTLELFEDGRQLGPAHAKHAVIREQGRGAFSHWRGQILFSSSDNSDPRTNGRRYTARFNGYEAGLN
jgi:predicted O-methyltransferase YrrM